jgi:hypothetical protein
LPLELDQPIADRTRTIIELDRRLDEEAPTRERTRLRPIEPAFEQCPHPELASGLGEGWADDALHEHGRAVLEHLKLERLFGVEMGEESALGQLQISGERADRETFETDFARQTGGSFQDCLVGQLALAHHED